MMMMTQYSDVPYDEKTGRQTFVGWPDEQQVVWVVGASSGIGEYYAREVSRRGATVVLSARREAALHRIKERYLPPPTMQ